MLDAHVQFFDRFSGRILKRPVFALNSTWPAVDCFHVLPSARWFPNAASVLNRNLAATEFGNLQILSYSKRTLPDLIGKHRGQSSKSMFSIADYAMVFIAFNHLRGNVS
ncbi:MAG: hypothetical protein U5Q16_10330 [Gammaproteobacteria bacterium]|nr:hypothetical protein [Gammaproteobacteria bacterium]